MEILRQLHILDGAVVHLLPLHIQPILRLLRLHGQLRADNHVAGAGAALIILSLEHVRRRMQVEERLVAEVRL